MTLALLLDPFGSNVTLSVSAAASDHGTLSYQWYSNTSNTNTGGSPVGENSPAYQPPTNAVGTTYYYVVVTNTNNTVTGNKTAAITSNPSAVTVQLSEDTAAPTKSNYTFEGWFTEE